MKYIVEIIEKGSGFPDVGDFVPGKNGNLYRVVQTNGKTHTSDSACGFNHIYAIVEDVYWDCLEENLFNALVVLEGE